MFENDNFSTNWELENLNFHSTKSFVNYKREILECFLFYDQSWHLMVKQLLLLSFSIKFPRARLKENDYTEIPQPGIPFFQSLD